MLGLVGSWRSKAHPATCFVAVETKVLPQLGTHVPPLFPHLGCQSLSPVFAQHRALFLVLSSSGSAVLGQARSSDAPCRTVLAVVNTWSPSEAFASCPSPASGLADRCFLRSGSPGLCFRRCVEASPRACQSCCQGWVWASLVSRFAFRHLSPVTSSVQLLLRASFQLVLGRVFPALREVVCVSDRRLYAFIFVPARAAFPWCVPKRGCSLRHFGDSWGVEQLPCPLVCCREGSQGISVALGQHPKFMWSSLQLSSCLCKQLFSAPLALLHVLAAGCEGYGLAKG